MKNSATDFELFTRHIYQKLVNNDTLKPTKVQHNVKLKGKSGCEHQIDVYWEYEIAGNKHRVAIECKNYKSSVSIGKVRDFKGVLDDLNNVNGIIVSSKGFQSGAKEYANEHGISLKELRVPGYNDTVGELIIRTHAEIRHCLFLIDEEYAKQKNLNLQGCREFLAAFDSDNSEKWMKATHLPLGLKDRIIRNPKGERVSSLDEIEEKLPENPKPNSCQTFEFEDAWIETMEFGSVKIREVKYEYESDDQERIFTLAAEDFVDGILKDAISGKTDYIPRY